MNDGSTKEPAEGTSAAEMLRETERLRQRIAALEKERDALAEKAQRYAEHYESSPDLCLTADAQTGIILECNETVAVANGYAKEELIGRSVFDLYPPDQHARLMQSFVQLRAEEEIRDVEVIGRRKDGSTFPMSLSVTPVRDGNGNIVAGRGIVRDITERKRAEDARQALVRELDHRVKNTLAIVEAIADHTLRTSASLEAFRTSYRARLSALARIHNAMSRNDWAGLDLRTLVELLLKPFAGVAGQIEIDGPAVDLSLQMTRALGMVLHELATNAGKYGALSSDAGSVVIAWELDRSEQSAQVRLRWMERDGPPVRPPERRGFGRGLIEDSIPYELDGRVVLRFPTDGVRCQIEFPLHPPAPPVTRYDPGS